MAALASLSPDGRKSDAIVLGNLTLAHARQRQFDEAVSALNRAIDIVEETRGGGGLNLVFAAVRELRLWRREPAVEDITDRLLALMCAA